MSLLIAYEDTYCRELDRTIRRAVKKFGALDVPREFHSVKGVTNFPGFVEKRWPLFRDVGFPVKGKPRQDALLCVADADVVAAQLKLRGRKKPYDEWIVEAEAEFTALLRSRSDQPERVHGALLRWNLESTLIAAYDQPEAMQRLAGSVRLDETSLEGFLERCQPDPRTVEEHAFTNTFDAPQQCLDDLARSLQWPRLSKGRRGKSNPRKDDALQWTSAHRLDTLLRRVPDIGRIAGLVREIAASI